MISSSDLSGLLSYRGGTAEAKSQRVHLLHQKPEYTVYRLNLIGTECLRIGWRLSSMRNRGAYHKLTVDRGASVLRWMWTLIIKPKPNMSVIIAVPP